MRQAVEPTSARAGIQIAEQVLMTLTRLALLTLLLAACATDPADEDLDVSDLATPYEAFTASSYWNTPLDAHGAAPVDGNNAAYVNALQTNNCTAESNCGTNEIDHLQLTIGNAYGQPFVFASATDPLHTVTCNGRSVTIRIPVGAKPQTGTDGEMTILDQTANVVAGFHKVVMGGGTIASCDALDRWHLGSNGLVSDVVGANDSFNTGHRGVPAPVRGVRLAEVTDGTIPHRLECFIYASKSQTQKIWPMDGFESNRGGTVPEGAVMRIRPDVALGQLDLSPQALPIAKALQDYGCIIGDNSGSSTRLKLEAYVSWNLTAESLKAIKWSSYEFVTAGYDPSTGTVH